MSELYAVTDVIMYLLDDSQYNSIHGSVLPVDSGIGKAILTDIWPNDAMDPFDYRLLLH